jgi:hypothetical protein
VIILVVLMHLLVFLMFLLNWISKICASLELTYYY